MDEKEILVGVKKAELSFARIEGFLNAAIDEMYPPQLAYGPIEKLLLHKKTAPKNATIVRLIRDQLYHTREMIKERRESLRDAFSDLKAMYEQEIEDVKNSK